MNRFALFLLTVLIACTNPNALRVTRETPIPPSGIGPTTLTFKLELNGQALSGAKVKVENTMTHPGMVPTVREAQEIGAGRYQAQRLEFSMAGEYEVFVTATKDGKSFKGSMPIFEVRQ